MYRIGICDDEISTCAILEKILQDIMRDFNIKADIEPWYSGESLCQNLNMGNRYDLIFLDSGLAKLNGIDVGNFIRNSLDDLKTYIIYISYNQSYAIELFKVQPIDFLIKPLTYEAVKKSVVNFLKMAEKKKLFLEYNIGNKYYKQPYEDIIYIRSDNKKIQLIMLQNQREFYGKLKILYEKMPLNFLQIHQSYIINKDYVIEYTYEYIKMINKDELNISRPYRNIVKKHLRRNK